ncbi:MAG: alpha/beta fold hydrolase [Acutalibacteraceae bacterium]|jgi:pimeloyl-ACP methyl ester carboxylesterase
METTIGGRKVAYIDQGSGPVVLLLHGWGAPGETYRLIVDHLSAYCRVIVPDLPGFGGSEEPEKPWNLDAFVDFAEAFAAQLELDEAILMGHSFGGRMIIKWMNRPGRTLRVKKIVLLDAAGIKPRRSLGYYIKVYRFKAAKWFFRLPGIRRLFPNAVENARKKHGSADYQQASPVMRQSMVMAINEDLTALLPGIDASTLLIWGENDTATPLSDGKLMEQKIPDAGLVVLAGAGHFAFAERWGQCARVLDAFLK